MFALTMDYIQHQVADSAVIFQRGSRLYKHGLFNCTEADPKQGSFIYEIDGNFGDYTTRIQLSAVGVHTDCDCPYPGKGCKHAVGVLLDVMDRQVVFQKISDCRSPEPVQPADDWLTADEIRSQALADRQQKARKEAFEVTLGDMLKGEHIIQTPKGRQYRVTLHDPLSGLGHCSCPDFLTNRLGTCKHLIHITEILRKDKKQQERLQQERFPFVDIFWDSVTGLPKMFCERPDAEIAGIRPLIADCFNASGEFIAGDIADIMPLIAGAAEHKRVRVQDEVLNHLDRCLTAREMDKLSQSPLPEMTFLKTRLYPYQEAGVRFTLYKPAALIGDQMGLGKTLQAIGVAILKKEIFGFNKILVVTLASLKEQWKREIERFSTETAVVITGSVVQRRGIYHGDPSLFKITNYETVLRDIDVIREFAPDIVILDEAQRIKNFETKTAETIKSIPRRHALVLTGTPLENKLEDVYSIVQFLEPALLSPLWRFAAEHFMLSRSKKGKILGYRNLDRLHDKLLPIVIRRRREEVLDDLPEEVINTYFVDLDPRQRNLHAGFAQKLLPLIHKKFLTPMDLRRIQELLLCMRRVCDSTYLIDRETHVSPKLKELESILDELVLANGRKVVIFSEWTTMTFLIAKTLSAAGISFVELTGKVPVPKRQALIDAFTHQPDCKVFLSTDAGGVGLNLQAGDCVINFDLPWNPAKLYQRIGRVNRIGQKSSHVHVVNLVAKDSIEEKILAGIQLKTDVFKGVFDGGMDIVEFSQEKRMALLGRLREMVEEPLPPPSAAESVEIPEDMPHFLNPEILGRTEPVIDDAGTSALPLSQLQAEEPSAAGEILSSYDAEETVDASVPEHADSQDAPSDQRNPLFSQPPEKIESVLNAGMQFIGGLLEMATGRPIGLSMGNEPMVQVDRERGEITLKFRLT
jgi:superfamily II DNA or RNA helicase/predicted nucleic acid-binding Zn finger protein